jgi:uncharacterized protein YgbK (DUF1537 family)
MLEPAAIAASGLVVTGGETARHLLRGWGVTGLLLTGEIEPGVPRASSLGGVAIPVVTKAGGFGTPGTLIRALASLHDPAGQIGPPARQREAAWRAR